MDESNELFGVHPSGCQSRIRFLTSAATTDSGAQVAPLPDDQIHVWRVDLDNPEQLCSAMELLSVDERARAERYHFEIYRRRFIRGRSALRSLLGEYMGSDPGSLEFGYEANGKPCLANATDKLSFNITHSEGLALIAVARQGQIGVDLERVRWLEDFDQLVERFFSKREAAEFGELRSELKPAAFFNLWTRKEALLKATGEGICNCLDRVEVTFLPGEPARLLGLPVTETVSDWTLCDLKPAPGYAAALAVQRKQFGLRCEGFEPEGASQFLETSVL